MTSKSCNSLSVLLLLEVAVFVIICGTLQAAESFWKKEKHVSEPVLYIASLDGNDTGAFTTDANIAIADGLNLVVVAHGWYEREPWYKDLALALKDKTDPNKWLCGWYDWRNQAKHLSPTDAAKAGCQTAGPLLGDKIVRLSKKWRHVHLIGHSCGAWVISEAAKTIAEQTDATLHLTFLDAYVPLFWNEKELGNLGSEPNLNCWADHYFTHDATLTVTANRLTHAHNVDLSDIDPGFNNHKMPRYWYHATVIGQYPAASRYGGKELFKRRGSLTYGFARSLEAGPENFQASRKLRAGNKPVKIKKPKKPLKSLIEALFKK